MKPFCIFLFLLCSATFSFADASSDSATKAIKIESALHQKRLDSLTGQIDSLKHAIPTTDLAYEPMTYMFSLLPALLFVVLVIVVVFALKGFNLREALTENDEVKITIVNPAYNSDTLTRLATKDATMAPSLLPPTIEVTNSFLRPDATATTATVAPNADANKPVDEKPEEAKSTKGSKGNFRPSSSRLIAFCSSVITLALSTCMTCFFIYYYISFGKAPDLNGLSTVLVALGLGVVPYASNKLASAVSSKKTNS